MIDHDRLFKQLISTFFLEFLALFFPIIRALVEDGSLVFLEKEILTDITSGDRHQVDLLANVRFKGEEAFFLIHVEAQSQPQPDFAKRMFRYFARIHEKYGLPVYPIAVFGQKTSLKPQEDNYEVRFSDGIVLSFHYRTVQLNQLSWRDFLRQPNPVASALMSQMNVALEDQPRVKLECVRMIATLRLNPAKTHLLLGFVDAYLRLSEEGKEIYRAELFKLPAEEKQMTTEMVMSWWEEALQEGRQQGLQEGLVQGMATLVTHQLQRRLGPIDSDILRQVSTLSSDRLEQLGDVLSDFSSLDDLLDWLRSH